MVQTDSAHKSAHLHGSLLTRRVARKLLPLQGGLTRDTTSQCHETLKVRLKRGIRMVRGQHGYAPQQIAKKIRELEFTRAYVTPGPLESQRRHNLHLNIRR